MAYYSTRPTRTSIQRITLEEAQQYVPLTEDFTSTEVDKCPFYTLLPDDEGWDIVTYYTARKYNAYVNRDSPYDSWVYMLSNPTMPGILKIGYTKLLPNERAKQLSNATGVALPYVVEWALHCYNAEQLEGEVHRCLESARVSNQREFFQIPLEEAKKVVGELGEQYL